MRRCRVFNYSLNHPTTIINPGARPALSSFRREVLAGLTAKPKQLPSKLFYDERGSQLFEAITRLPEYYLTRTEIAIFEAHLLEMAALIGPNALVIEFGTGAGVKTRMLLMALDQPRAYIPVDISREQLARASRRLSEQFPTLEISPVCGDYTKPITIPRFNEKGKRMFFFPGSTIGNFMPEQAVEFLKGIAMLLGDGSGLLIGFDLVKDKSILEAAYNDAEGITAEFNLHLIERVAAAFDLPISPERFRTSRVL